MLSPELEAELRAIIRPELQLAVRAIVDEGLEPLLNVVATMQEKHSALLATLCESTGAIVDSQARIERAVADATGGGDDDAPWRESLQDDD
ncbi:MAG: hypothetical protein JNL18_10355 [Planctomycetaceae bacterium]|uniref:Uncharacterized protein n=1 Tax=Lacipirellula limnantheis TaxID=2528024 RepID=A0A517TV04_9BACT|nr:hypothetical protein [Lacipirellula limnantheis]MBL9163125.1 hypothetical protein [Planctomycetaceae bacterium]QDT72216.1 hypothetical protein I41_13860 [Lacipirellula limnantheis]